MEDIVVFPGLNVFNSDNFYIISCSRNEQVTFVAKPQLKIIHTLLLIMQRVKGTVVNRALPVLHGGSNLN